LIFRHRPSLSGEPAACPQSSLTAGSLSPLRMRTSSRASRRPGRRLRNGGPALVTGPSCIWTASITACGLFALINASFRTNGRRWPNRLISRDKFRPDFRHSYWRFVMKRPHHKVSPVRWGRPKPCPVVGRQIGRKVGLSNREQRAQSARCEGRGQFRGPFSTLSSAAEPLNRVRYELGSEDRRCP
jgi:hypothetical protein